MSMVPLFTDDILVWDQFYIGPRDNSYFDEELVSKKPPNKLLKAFNMCASEFQLAVLNNAFLIRRPSTSWNSQEQRVKSRKALSSGSAVRVQTLNHLLLDMNYKCTLFYSSVKQ